jgi:tetratricopeptide (TPR) repeat protein
MLHRIGRRVTQPRTYMRSFSSKVAAEISCLLLYPSMTFAQATVPNEIRESLSQTVQKYLSSGSLPDAEKPLELLLNFDEKAHGRGSREVAEDSETLSNVLSEDGKYAEAEAALKASLAAYAVIEGPERATNSFYLGRMASLAGLQQKFAEAEKIYDEILAIQRKEQGAESPVTLEDLAELCHVAKDYGRSEAIYRKVIESKVLDLGSGVTLGAVERLSTVYEEQGKFEQVEALYRKAVETSLTSLPHGHLTTIAELNDLGLFYERRERIKESEEYYRRALEQFDGLAPDASLMDSNLAVVIENYARLLRNEGRFTEAEQYESRGTAIRTKLSESHSSN